LKYKVDAEVLRNAGIVETRVDDPDGQNVDPLPNRCYHEAKRSVTLSDKFVAHYKTRGFSLAAICMAATSGAWVRYDTATGKPLRTLNGFLLDIPDCFKNGAPFLDCEYNFEENFGMKAMPSESRHVRNRAIEVDKAVRTLIKDGKFSRPCACNDLEAYQPRYRDGKPLGDAFIQIKGSGYGGQNPAVKYACRVEKAPACAEGWLPDRDVLEEMVYEVQAGYLFQWTPLKGSTDYGPFDISPSLPRGYVYKIGHPEGDDDTPYINADQSKSFELGE